VHALEKYRSAVASMLQDHRFDELDCLADLLRSSKARFAGGMWKLHIFYWGLEAPFQHATENDWKSHLQTLQLWVSANPASVTARIAQAEAHLNYAWAARGDGFGDTVSDNGWRLFRERTAETRKILEKAATLKTRCPEWYVAMESVALAQGWNSAEAHAPVEQTLSSEPQYYYVYRLYADYLQPKWYGDEGESENFVSTIANRVGGEKGDELYFQVGSYLVCDCPNQHQLDHLSWPRLQKGFAGLEKEHGASLTNLNLLALMAVKMKDPVVADRAFRRIGDQWSQATWKNQSHFDSSKTWAAQVAPGMAAENSIENEAEANLQSPDGPGYQAARKSLRVCFNRAARALAPMRSLS